MAVAMVYGVPACVLATFFYTFLISIVSRSSRKVHAYMVIFNTASTICCAWLYSSIYHYINQQGSVQLRDVIAPAAILVATFFVTNSILTSIAIAWARGDSIVRFWIKTCLPLAVDYSLSSVCATIIVVLYGFSKYIPLAVAPLIGVAWGWTKWNSERVTSAEKHLREQEQLYRQTVESLALAVDAKDQTTYGHIRRVTVYAMGLARLCGIKDRNELNAIETGSLLHDIGKIAVDDYILNKPGRLSKEEFEIIKMHAAAGDEILQQIHFPFPVAKYVRSHHERWDGLGYPDGLKGEEIPLGARILAIADAFDAIRFSRPYKLPVATEEAVDILRAQAGIVYDPKLVQLFTDHIEELEQAAIRESENAPRLSFRKYYEKINHSPSVIPPNPAISRDIPAELIKLAEFCSSISGYLDLKDILPILARRLEQLVPFSTCSFYLNNGDGRIGAAFVIGRFSDLLQKHVIEMGNGISGWVAAYRRPMINTGPALDFQDIQGDFSSLKDALVVPILHNDESLGTISLYAQEPGSYSQYDLNILQALAGFLAPLISESKRRSSSPSEDVIDATTQIPRISYLAALGPQLLSLASQNRSPVSLIYLEVRNLGQIVRILGANLGNSILRRIADCIKPELRETDILVRYGHQGFVAFLPGVRDEQAVRCVWRLKQQIRSEVPTAGQAFAIDCKAGVSSYPKDGATIFALLQSAQENTRSDIPETASPDSKVVDFFPRS
jgi:diguanylate cyclase (GGDEF)-like protein/putative nucleotidyltransferase with HDIG domain